MSNRCVLDVYTYSGRAHLPSLSSRRHFPIGPVSSKISLPCLSASRSRPPVPLKERIMKLEAALALERPSSVGKGDTSARNTSCSKASIQRTRSISFDGQSMLHADQPQCSVDHTAYELPDIISPRTSQLIISSSNPETPEEISPSPLTIEGKLANRAFRIPTTVMPCCEPEDVIIARAECRIRKQLRSQAHLACEQAANRARIEQMEKSRTIHIIEHSAKRVSIYRQKFFLVVLKLKAYTHEMKKRYIIAREEYMAPRIHAAEISQRIGTITGCVRWIIMIQIRRKRKAVEIVKSAITSLANSISLKKGIHRLRHKARVIQRAVRSHISARKASLDSLSLVWDKLEFEILLGILKQRVAKSPNSGCEARQVDAVDSLLRVPSHVQGDRWGHSDLSTVKILKKSKGGPCRVQRVLPHQIVSAVTITDSFVRQYMIPIRIREQVIFDIFQQKRKEYIHSFFNRINMKTVRIYQPVYTEDDAREYLRGRMDQGINSCAVMGFKGTFNALRVIREDELRRRIIALHKHSLI